MTELLSRFIWYKEIENTANFCIKVCSLLQNRNMRLYCCKLGLLRARWWKGRGLNPQIWEEHQEVGKARWPLLCPPSSRGSCCRGWPCTVSRGSGWNRVPQARATGPSAREWSELNHSGRGSCSACRHPASFLPHSTPRTTRTNCPRKRSNWTIHETVYDYCILVCTKTEVLDIYR